jgi:nitrite reductase (NADH) small subunit
MIVEKEIVNGVHVKRWTRIAYCRDIPLREGRAVRVNGREIAIFNLGDRFVAVDNRCPHRGGPLADGIVSGATIVCPLHAWKFNLETGVGVGGPSQSSCVETFHTRVENGVVLLELEPTSAGSEEIPAACLGDAASPPWRATVCTTTDEI